MAAYKRPVLFHIDIASLSHEEMYIKNLFSAYILLYLEKENMLNGHLAAILKIGRLLRR